MPCISLFFVTGNSQAGVASLTWSGTLTANAKAGSLQKSDVDSYSVDASVDYWNFSPSLSTGSAHARASITDGQTASIDALLDLWGYNLIPSASFSIEGNFSIASTPAFPSGTPLLLKISGNMSYLNSISKLFRDDVLIWNRNLTNGSFTDYCPVFAGESIAFINSGTYADTTCTEKITLEVVPEPATLLLLGLGGLILRGRKS